MAENKHKEIWVGVKDLTNDPQFLEAAKQEFPSNDLAEGLGEEGLVNAESNRRDFLKYLGFGIGAATIAASCEIPVKRAIPYTVKPDTIVPGIANYYASSFVNGGDYAAILVKTREGRPIKIENNSLSKVNPEGSHARAQAVVLSLYDVSRYKTAGAIADGKFSEISWTDLDKTIKSKLAAGGAVRIITNTILSPTTKKVLAEFAAKYPNTKVVSYDPVSSSAMLMANEQCFGDGVIPSYRFDNAQVIVSFNADFLGTWISPIEYAAQYSKNRKIGEVKGATMSRHIQVESNMSLTGSNADNRILVKPSEQGAAIAALYNEVAALTGGAGVSAPKVNDKAAAALKKTAKELVANKGKALVVSASNNVGEQILVNKINDMLGSYGSTIDFANASLQRQGKDTDIQDCIKEMASGSVSTVIVLGANPAYDLPNSEAFKAAFAKVGTKVSTAIIPDETTALCNFVAPNHHLLESWGDAQPKRGQYSLIQPTIRPIFNTRQSEQSLLTWAESANLNTAAEQPYYEYLKANWQTAMFAGQKSFASAQGFWDSVLHDGVFGVEQAPKAVKCGGDAASAAAQISKPSGAELEIGFYETINGGNGQYSSNPWLLEMADPVNRTVWGNYLSVPMNWDGVNNYTSYKNLNDGDIVKLSVNGKEVTAIVVRQFGQMEGTVGLALGYGRTVSNRAAVGVGVDTNPMLTSVNGLTQYYATNVQVSDKVGVDKDFACVQYHHSIGITGMGKEENKIINADEKILGYKGYQGSLTDRSIVYTAHVKELTHKVESLREQHKEFEERNSKTLYPGHDDKYKSGNKWGMFVDLNACTGCSACTVACMSENNIPIVGKKEVHRHHEMTWLRIDRYYYGSIDNPSTIYQPMMCQHCDNAPCENVCPVNATSHSAEGLNQMTYNRCIGTRYCANNCPYKVRRFNWLDFTTADLFGWNENYSNDANMNNDNGIPFYADNLTRMVLNPDVTVRTRGVIEKCSFCVQRIQEGKLTAKRENRKLEDADVKTACQTACPTGAITFGNVNNPDGAVSKKLKSELSYRALEEINVGSAVRYTMKVHNRSEDFDA